MIVKLASMDCSESCCDSLFIRRDASITGDTQVQKESSVT